MRELRLVLLALAAIIAVSLGASFLSRAFMHSSNQIEAGGAVAPRQSGSAMPAGSSAPAGSESPVRAEIDRSIAATPDYARFFDRLRTVFPAEYATILDGLAANAKPGEVNVDLVIADAVTALRRAHGALAIKASDGSLTEIFRLQLREMQALAQRDPHLCVAFLYGANGNGFLGFAADNRPLIAEAAIAGLDAMNSGRSDQVARGAPTDDDFQTLDRALMAKNLTRPEIDELLDGKTADPPIADTEMCRAGQTYLETLATLPVDVRDRLYGLAVDLMARS